MISHYWFDMDHTLIDNDCDVSWKHFVVSKKLADSGETERLADHYYQQYLSGTLDPEEFMDFQLREFRGNTPETMAALALEHFETMVKPKLYRDAFVLCHKLAASHMPLAIVTSTNTVIARPLATFLGIDDLFGAQLEIKDNHYTGKLTGIYPVGPGKVAILENYCKKHLLTPSQFAYYGDSINDRFILEIVGEPHAVNPGTELRVVALKNHWDIVIFQ